MILIFDVHEHLYRLEQRSRRPESLLLHMVGHHLYREYHLNTVHRILSVEHIKHYPEFHRLFRIELSLVGTSIVRTGSFDGHLTLINNDLCVTLETTRIGAHAPTHQISDHHLERLGRYRHCLDPQFSIHPTRRVQSRPEVVEKLSLKWTIKDSTHWVGVMLDDEFNRQMAWADGTDVAFDSIMLQMSEKYGSALPQILHLDKPNKTQRTLFLEDLIVTLDPVTVVIGEFVSDLVKQNPWWVWSIHGRGDVVLLESDEDFRIKMFNQKIETGEWSIK